MRASNDVANGPGWAVMLLFDPYQRDARVEKEAATLVGAGYRVTVLAWNRFGIRTSPVRKNLIVASRLPYGKFAFVSATCAGGADAT